MFPYKTIRKEQEQAIEFCINAFNSGKRYVVVEAGTGCGKSAIGLTVGRYMNHIENVADEGYDPGTYFVTTQKILQDQYTSDFGGTKGEMCAVKSASNYSCSHHKKNNCQESQRLLKTEEKQSSFFKNCTFNCVYKKTKERFLESQESVTNFPYFLTEAAFSGKIVPRKFLVVDEAHNVESALSNFIEVIVSKRFTKQMLKLNWPKKKSQYAVFKWIRDEYFPVAQIRLSHFKSQLESLGLSKRIEEFQGLNRQLEMLSGHVEKLSTFLRVYDKDNWLLEIVPPKNRSQEKFSFKPIDVSPFADKYITRLGKRVLFMSATILSKEHFCRSMGLSEADTAFISLPSPFPIENRPVLFSPVGSMSAKVIDSTLPKMLKSVKAILDAHPSEKGIIHAHTYKIAKYLKDNLKSKRILIHNSENRDKILKKHIKSKSPTVIISPSMSEGVDLKDDRARFQILCKVPYPYLGDPLIRKRMNKFRGWYSTQVAKTVMQSIGRSVRSMDDSAITYILDADWARFYKQNKQFFPKSFKECIV